MKKEKLPKRIQEIIDNQGKTVEKASKEMQQSIDDIRKAGREANEKLRKLLGC